MLRRWQDHVDDYVKYAILQLLRGISNGVLVIESTEKEHEFGKKFMFTVDLHSEPLKAKITVKNESFWKRVFFDPDNGLAEAFMFDEIEVDNLSNLFKIYILNRKTLSGIGGVLSSLMRTLGYLANFSMRNGITGSRRNVAAHYDLSNDIFASFLSWDMTYTCAIFNEALNGPTGDLLYATPIAPPRVCYSNERLFPADDLEKAQMAKMQFVARRARIKGGSRVLEIGCGWGSFAIFVAATYGASVEALTLSAEQGKFAEQNVKHAGMSHLINIHVCDYREMPKVFHRAFDAVVSLGMMEHVGIEFMGAWFKKVEWAMKPNNAVKVFNMSTVPDTRWLEYSTEVDFARRYLFPGAQLSSVKTLVGHIADAGLNIVSIDDIGPHYARTFREWFKRFDNNFESHIRPALMKKYPNMTEWDVRVFERKWRYYFMYCETGFVTRNIQDHIFVCSREVNLDLISTTSG